MSRRRRDIFGRSSQSAHPVRPPFELSLPKTTPPITSNMKFAATSLAAVVLLGLHGTSAQDDCVPCDDKPTPIMEDKGKKCDEFPNVIESKCRGADNWVENKFCRYTCSMNGRGYRDEEECCANGPATAEEVEPKDVPVSPLPTTTEGEENTTSTPPNIPAIAVSDEPASNGDGTEEAGGEENEVNCTPCDDKPTPIMIGKGKVCSDFPTIISTRCKDADNWVENKFCRKTCFENRRGYEEDDCCDAVVETPPTLYDPAQEKDKNPEEEQEEEQDDGDDDDGGDKSGRLRMYCENKFYWQGKSTCKDWCLEMKSCKEGSGIEIQKCSSTSKQKWKKDGNVLRPACDSKLCVANGKLTRDSISLDGLKSDGNFEIQKYGGCMTQSHHPRANEPVSFRDCAKARRSHTNRWEWK